MPLSIYLWLDKFFRFLVLTNSLVIIGSGNLHTLCQTSIGDLKNIRVSICSEWDKGESRVSYMRSERMTTPKVCFSEYAKLLERTIPAEITKQMRRDSTYPSESAHGSQNLQSVSSTLS
jgi:hypothetical protein